MTTRPMATTIATITNTSGILTFIRMAVPMPDIRTRH